MRYFSIFLLGLLFLFTSCRKDFDTVPSSGKLEFSKTEVYLDTVSKSFLQEVNENKIARSNIEK